MSVPCWTKAAAWLPDKDFEPGGQVFSRGEWLTIIRVNKSNGAVSSVTTPNYSFLQVQRHDESDARSHHGLQSTIGRRGCRRQSGRRRPPGSQLSGEGFREMTKAQWAALPRTVRPCAVWKKQKNHGAYRYRRTMDNNFRLVNVYITDMKITEIHRNKCIPRKSPGMTEIMTCTVS